MSKSFQSLCKRLLKVSAVEVDLVKYNKATSFEENVSAFDDLASNISPSLIHTVMRGTLRAGPYGPILALFVGGAGYAALGAITGGKAIAATFGASKAKNLSQHEQDLITFHEHFLKPLVQLLQVGE